MAAAPIIPSAGCTGVNSLNPLCAAAGAGSTLAGDGAGAILAAVTQWVVQGAVWLLDQIGAVLGATTTVDLGSAWFGSHYDAMAAVASVVVLPMLLLAVMQAIYRQTASLLLRSFLVNLPLALLLTGVAIEVVRLALATTDALCGFVANGSGVDIAHALDGVSTALQQSGDTQAAPFVLLLGALMVAVASFLLWVELLVRSAAVYVAVLFLPLALVSLVWPAVSHWTRRLVETLAALILSKLVVVAILSLATGAIASGTAGTAGGGFAPVLAGGALLLLASFAPFVLLRLIPVIEAGAVHQLEGARQRVQSALGSGPGSAATFALRQVRGAMAAEALGGTVGTGLEAGYEAPGGDTGAGEELGGAAPGGRGGPGAVAGAAAGAGAAGRGAARAPGAALSGSGGDAGAGGTDSGAGSGGIPTWRGDPEADRLLAEVLGGRAATGAERMALGPMPVLTAPGAPPADQAPPEDEGVAGPGPVSLGSPRPGSQPGPAGRGTYSVGRDEMGPVLRWSPPGGPTAGD